VTTPDIQTLSHPMSDWRHLLQVLRQVHVSIKNENKNEQNSTKRVTRTRNTFLAEIQLKNSNWGTFAAYSKIFGRVTAQLPDAEKFIQIQPK
jgi:hypothetical protein